MTNYDLAIIGSGPGGYVSAIYAARHNLKVCVIESGLTGGTCLNRGCIPTKSLLNSASIISTIKNSSYNGIDISGWKINFEKMVSKKDEIVTRLRTGVETLLRANKVDLIHGRASITGPNAISVDGGQVINSKNIIIASGSRTAGLGGVKPNEIDILSSDGILNLKTIPSSLLIVGGGVIGCEFASLFNLLGAKVTIVEFADRLVSLQSKEASKKLEMSFTRRGIDVVKSSTVGSIKKEGLLKVVLSDGKTIEAEKVLVSIGRIANIDSMGDLGSLGIVVENGKIVVDDNLRTGLKNVYAIGDCVNAPFLAHKASYDALLAVDNILGGDRKPDYSNVPSTIWTDPQIASVGMSEEDARAKHPDARVAKFPYLASGKAFLMGKPEGFVKIIGNANGNILGVEIFGEEACELIAEAVLARTANITIEEWSRAVHAHPTLSEILQEAAHVFCGTPIHGI